MMYKVEAIVREEKLEDIKEALHGIEVNGVTLSQVMGFGMQRGYKTVVRGQEIQALQKVAATGEVGDGKIFAYEITNVVKIRTGEADEDALR